MIHNNLNTLNKKVEFGISPFGIFRTNTKFANGKTGEEFWDKGSNNDASCLSCYKALYADVVKWMEKGWIDYVTPQNYFDFDNAKVNDKGEEKCQVKYADLAKWWSEICYETNTKLYMGQAIYRYGTDANWKDVEEIPNQIKYNQTLGNVKGTMFFTYKDFVREDNETLVEGRKLLKKLWTKDCKEI